MLDTGTVTANIPASDLPRARSFYAEKLGVTPAVEFDGMLRSGPARSSGRGSTAW